MGACRLTRGDRNCDWIQQYCRIPEGKDVGKPVKLRPWQRKEIKKIYDNPHGTRRAIISFGRKNAKTTLAAFLLLLHTCGPEARQNSQLNSAAQSKEQAAILFKLAAKVVRMSPDLNAVVVVRDTIKELYCPELGTLYKALSADASTAYGLSPVFIVHDELGQVKGPRSELYDALETAVGAHDAPLSIIISTQAPTDADLLSILIDDALQGNDPCVVVSLYTAPLDIDPFGEDAMRLANPAFGDFLNADLVRGMAEDARRMPARESQYRNLVLNQRVEASAPFVSRSLWQSCSAEPAEFDRWTPIYAGLDLSAVNDLTALVLIGKMGGVWSVKPYFWLPADGLVDKARKDRVPYDVWERDGHLLAAPGKSIDYEFVAKFLFSLVGELDIRKIAFDRWGFRHLRPWLIAAGFSEEEIDERFEEFGQGFQSMSPALRELEGDLLNGRVAHGNHPVLSMCAANAVVVSDPSGNRKLAKDKSSGRIDGMVALAMARGVAPFRRGGVSGLRRPPAGCDGLLAVFSLGSWFFGWGDDYRAKISGRDGYASERPESREYGTGAALRLGAVWACVRLLSETIGTLPLGFFERAADGGRTTADKHPLYRLLHDSPNADQTAAEFWEAAVASLCTAGNFYAEKKFADDGRLLALDPFRSGSIAVCRNDRGARVYRHTDGSKTRELTEDRVFHIRGFGLGGDVGLSPISYARDSLGLAIDTDLAARSAFQNGVRGSGFLIVPGKPTPDQKKGLRETFIDPMIGASQTAKAGILEQGMDWKEVKGMPPEDLQLIEGRAFNVEELCRWFRVPPFMIGHTEKTTSWGTGLEQQMIGFLTFSLRPYLTRIEQAVKKQLILPGDRSKFYAEFNLEGLLRADSTGRSEMYSKLFQVAGITPNQIADKENLPRFEGGDNRFINSTYVPLDMALNPPVAATPTPPAQEIPA